MSSNLITPSKPLKVSLKIRPNRVEIKTSRPMFDIELSEAFSVALETMLKIKGTSIVYSKNIAP